MFAYVSTRCRPLTRKELSLSSTLPLTSAQYGVWNAQRLNPESPYYVVGEVLHLGPGHIELETLKHSITQLQQEADTCNAGNREISEDNPVCAQVQAAMEGLLGHPIDLEENFFASGGDSLLAMRLMGILRKQGIQLKIQDIVDAGTPAAIAGRMEQGIGGAMNPQYPQYPPQPQRFQTTEYSQHRPVWCIHPIGGHGLAFAPLARLLSPTVLYTRLIELPSPLPQVETLGELAELYTEQILAEQGNGPFALVGYSFGGMVAEKSLPRCSAGGMRCSSWELLTPIPVAAVPAPARISRRIPRSMAGQPLVTMMFGQLRVLMGCHTN